MNAIQLLQNLVSALQEGRRGYQDGVVVDLHSAADKVVYLVGDLHAKRSRIPAIMEHANLLPQLQDGSALLVFLGDLFHREDEEFAEEMESSLGMLFDVARLKIAFPNQVFALLGNHEFTRTNRSKHGVCQGALMRQAIENLGLGELYDAFIQASPLVVIHPRFAASHAGPALSVASLAELKALPVADCEPHFFHPAVRELTHFRHIDHDLSGRSSFTQYDIADFLTLCGVPEGPLLNGHTPLNRETGWQWPMGPRNHVIFAAGREIGYARADANGVRLVRLGRSLREDDDSVLFDRSSGVDCPLGAGGLLEPDRLYTLTYQRPLSLASFELRKQRDLPAWHRAAPGFYLVGLERRLVKLKKHDTILVGTAEAREALLLTQREEGEFEIRALVEGIAMEPLDR